MVMQRQVTLSLTFANCLMQGAGFIFNKSVFSGLQVRGRKPNQPYSRKGNQCIHAQVPVC